MAQRQACGPEGYRARARAAQRTRTARTPERVTARIEREEIPRGAPPPSSVLSVAFSARILPRPVPSRPLPWERRKERASETGKRGRVGDKKPVARAADSALPVQLVLQLWIGSSVTSSTSGTLPYSPVLSRALPYFQYFHCLRSALQAHKLAPSDSDAPSVGEIAPHFVPAGKAHGGAYWQAERPDGSNRAQRE